eukprot:TRINITY_DN1715_c0_g1_i1.p1 TRINITY_DN1715_c0_g1~~TRINITY_DN1715_c0_g1_i1.p1  ORF type:complete len:282 (-),score=80.48 TRINITY_DN1715_c0_g1_i1:69-914(-)
MEGGYDGWNAAVSSERPAGGGVGGGLGAGSTPYTSGVALPEQHEDQLNLGFRMVSTAFNNKVQGLENELQSLRTGCDDSKKQAVDLQRKNSQLEQELHESHSRSQKLAEDNKELYKQVQQLRRQLQGLEGLKQKVMHSISSHEHELSGVHHHESHEDSFRSRALPSPPAHSQGASPQFSRPISVDPVALHAEAPRADMSGQAGMPVNVSGNGPVDGKQFFRQARNSLTYEAFNEFLANIKRLNTGQQTREETLDAAKRIFGREHEQLYREFEELLNNVVSM